MAPLVAAFGDPALQFVVLLAGPGQTVRDQIRTNTRAEMLAEGSSEEAAEARTAQLEGQLRLIRNLQAPCRALKAHYLCFGLDYDPQPTLEALKQPVLALDAGLDTQVPAAVNIPLVEAALQALGTRM